MAIVGEFGAAKREASPDREPDQIIFYGERFTIASETGTMPLLEFAAAAEQGADASDMRGLAAMHALFEDCLIPEDWPRFKAVARENKADADVLLAVCGRVYEVISGRPTQQPSDSAGGLSTTSLSPSPSPSLRAELGLVPVSELLTG